MFIWLLFISYFLPFVQGQGGLWDYGDYNSILFPSSFGMPPFPPFNGYPQRQIQPPQLPPLPQQHMSPNSRLQPPPPLHIEPHYLGTPSYRSPANQFNSFGNPKGPYYTGRGNSFVGPSSLSDEHQNNKGDLDSLLARIVTKLPSIASQLSQMITTTSATPSTDPEFWLPFVQPDNQRDTEGGLENEDRRRSPSTVINSMPNPSSFFSFSKLLNAFTGSGLEEPVSFAKQTDPETTDIEAVKGIPILKDEDWESEVVPKVEAAHSLESNEAQVTDDDKSTTPELIIFTLPPREDEETTTTTPEPIERQTEMADNLLGSLLSGKLDKVDWIGSIFGENKKDHPKNGEDGNALARLFSGSFFGSAMNDDDQAKQRKHEDRNFH